MLLEIARQQVVLRLETNVQLLLEAADQIVLQRTFDRVSVRRRRFVLLRTGLPMLVGCLALRHASCSQSTGKQSPGALRRDGAIVAMLDGGCHGYPSGVASCLYRASRMQHGT